MGRIAGWLLVRQNSFASGGTVGHPKFEGNVTPNDDECKESPDKI